jgi:hypothetical protein
MSNDGNLFGILAPIDRIVARVDHIARLAIPPNGLGLRASECARRYAVSANQSPLSPALTDHQAAAEDDQA